MKNNTKENKKSNLIFEISIKVNMKDYQFKLATKRAWLFGLGMAIIKLLDYLWKDG